MANFINTVDIIGDDALTNSIIDRSIVQYADNSITVIGNAAFNGCNALENVNFPNVTSCDLQAFYNCTSLISVDLPACTTVNNSAFFGCSLLERIDLPMCNNIGTYVFYGTALTALILRSNTVCNLSNKNALTNTPIVSGTGYIYIPSALLSRYQSASNWSDFSTRFRALEDFTADGTITGELDPTKI